MPLSADFFLSLFLIFPAPFLYKSENAHIHTFWPQTENKNAFRIKPICHSHSQSFAFDKNYNNEAMNSPKQHIANNLLLLNGYHSSDSCGTATIVRTVTLCNQTNTFRKFDGKCSKNITQTQ